MHLPWQEETFLSARPISYSEEPELHYLVRWTAESLRTQVPRLLLTDDPEPFVRASLDDLILSEGSLQEWSFDQLVNEIRVKLSQCSPSRDYIQ